MFDFVEPEPALLVADLFDHVETDPAHIVDADLIERPLDQRAFKRIIKTLLVHISWRIHSGDQSSLP